MPFLSDLGSGLIKAVTGQDPAQLQQQLSEAEAQLTMAVETMIGLQAIMAAELFLIVVLLWKERH